MSNKTSTNQEGAEPISEGPATAESEKVSKRTMGLVSLAVFSSRILGLVREIVFNSLFGGNMIRWGDAFTTAFRVPNLLRDLFA
ncbi:MAG: murein biosynthesis integral membrane protein MurJ, partial [Roseimicrobium sp.]